MTWMSSSILALGVTSDPQSTFAQILPVLLILVGVVFAGFILISLIRRRTAARSFAPPARALNRDAST